MIAATDRVSLIKPTALEEKLFEIDEMNMMVGLPKCCQLPYRLLK
jgi:hypothetical protein